jgi:acyl carrier protein
LVGEILGDRPHLAVALNGSRQKDSDRQLREAVVKLRVAGLSLSSLDPYQLPPQPLPVKHPLSISLESVNYVSDKTKQAFEDALQNGHHITRTPSTLVTEETVTSTVHANGHSPDLAIMTKPTMFSHEPSRTLTPKPIQLPLERILSSLEQSLMQFHQHQQETLDVHRQYLQYQSQYAHTVFQLMQQHNQLWTTVQTTPQEVQVKTAVLDSAERSLTQFQAHQSDTLRVHEQYLNHQADYTKNFFLLTQQSYARFLQGDWEWEEMTTPVEETVASITVAESGLAVTQEFNTVEISRGNGNGHHTPTVNQTTTTTPENGLSVSTPETKTAPPENGHSLPIQETQPIPETVPPENGHSLATQETQPIPETAPPENGHSLATQETQPTPEVAPPTLPKNGHSLPTQETQPIPETQLPPTLSPPPENGHHLTPTQTSPTLSNTEALAEIDLSNLSEILLEVVSDKTGYPVEMLEVDMDMEADLGIDSIKRVEIVGALQEQVPDLPQPNLEELAELRTLEQISEYLQSFAKQTANGDVPVTTPEETTVTESVAETVSIQDTFLSVVSEKTGYLQENLNLDMHLETDLGIDLVKRREIWNTLQAQLPTILPANGTSTDFNAFDTLGQILDYFHPDSVQKKTSISVNVS